MVPLRCVIKPHKSTRSTAKFTMDSCITSRDRIGNHTCDHIKWDIINAKAPDKILNVADMFLMRFRSKQGFKQPCTIMNLSYMTNLCQLGNALSHNRNLVITIQDFLHCNRASWTSVYNTFVVLYRHCIPLAIKYWPKLSDQTKNLVLDFNRKVR